MAPLPEPPLIIGGGLAGAAAACRLAQLGCQAELVERSTGPNDKICGEFLSIETQHDLLALGIDVRALGAEPIRQLRLVAGSQVATQTLPFIGLSLSRRVLDEALLARAAALGAVVRRGATIGRIEISNGLAHPAGMATTRRALVLATGKHELRGAPRTAEPSALVGFKMYFRPSPAAATRLEGTVTIHLFDGGYAGLEPVEGNRCNLCLLVTQQRFAAVGRSWDHLLTALYATDPVLAASLAGARPLLDKPLAIAGVPYGFVHRPAADDPANLFRVGDQLAVIPSFSGDGMAIALRSGIRAAEAIALGQSAAAYHRQQSRLLGPQVRRAQFITRLGGSGLGRRLLVTAARWPRIVQRAVLETRLRPDRLEKAGQGRGPWTPLGSRDPRPHDQG